MMVCGKDERGDILRNGKTADIWSGSADVLGSDSNIFEEDSSIGADRTSNSLGMGEPIGVEKGSNSFDLTGEVNFSGFNNVGAHDAIGDDNLGYRGDSELVIEKPDVNVSMTSKRMSYFRQLKKLSNIITGMVKLFLITLVFSFFGAIITAFLDYKSVSIVLCIITFASVGLLFLLNKVNGWNNRKANILFKKDFVQQELKKYINELSIKKSEYIYGAENVDKLVNCDLTENDSPEYVMSALGVYAPDCNKNYINEWIGGIYQDVLFRFFEVKLTNFYKSGKSRNEDVKFEGQGYIFKMKITMPISIFYRFNSNIDPGMLLIENFDQIFTKYKYDCSSDIFSLSSMESFSSEEQNVIDIIEAREFKVCLLKLAKIFTKYGLLLGSTRDKLTNWSIRLQEQNIIILRTGSFDYFELYLYNQLWEEFEKISLELSEFFLVLETINALTLVSGEK